MPAVVETDPPGIWCMFSDGSTASFSLDGLPCPGLAGDLLTGLAGLIHPHGRVDAAGTAGVYIRAFREITRTLAAAGFTGRAADLRRPHLTGYWMGTTADRESCTRRALAAFARDGGTLHPAVAELAAGRNFNPVSNHKPLPPYREAEWERLAAACAAVADAAFAAHKEALAAAARGNQPGKDRWSRENIAWLLARTGPVGAARLGQLAGCSPGVARRKSGFQDVSADLFPTLDTVIAYRLLFGIYSGIVPDGIADLTASDIDWAGDASVLLSYVKRRTAAESLNLPRRAVRLLEQWLGHSALLRSHAGSGDRERLWLGTSHSGGDMLIKNVNRVAIQRWVLRHNVTSDDGGPLKIHRSRIRTTHLSLRDKSAWAGRGRATIDPNHSPQVEGDHYLTAATPAQQHAVDTIVADAQHDLIRRAHPPAVITDEDAAGLATRLPATGHLARPGRQRARRARQRDARRVHRGLRRPAVRPARAEGPALPGPALGLPALPAGGLRPAARREPAAAESVLLPAMAADARRPVHGRVRPVLPADRPGAGPLRPRRPGPGSPPRRR